MERAGICSICASVSKLNTCPICGRLVCNKCFDFPRNACVQCSRRNPLLEMSLEKTGMT